MSQRAECPECATTITLDDDVMQGEIVQCSDCGAELEVFTEEGLELRPVADEEEDWGE